MLPTRHRMRTSAQFTTTVRSGARSGRRNIVVSVRMHTGEPSRVGFVVSKAVGNAVTRNKVKRRLRELSAALRRDHPAAVEISAGMSADLADAIRWGSTRVRVGSAIMGPRPRG